jgi:hypothetical protein
MNPFEVSRQTGLSMAEVGRIGGLKAAKKRREAKRPVERQLRLQERFQAVKAAGGDWWNRD